MLRRIALKKVDSVGAGRTALIELPLGPRYHHVMLVLGNTAAADVNAPADTIATGVRVLANGRVQRKCTGTQLNGINTGMGAIFAAQAVAGAANGGGRLYLPIFFGEPWRKDVNAQDALAIQSAHFNSFQVEVDIIAGVTPVLSAYAVVDDFTTKEPQRICKWQDLSFGAVGAKVQVNTLDPRDFYTQISVFNTSDAKTITAVKFEHEGRIIHELSKNENDQLLKNWGMNPAANRYDVVFDHDDVLGNAVPGSKLMIMDVDLSAAAAGTLPVIAQRIGYPE